LPMACDLPLHAEEDIVKTRDTRHPGVEPPTLPALVCRVAAEYREMPGLTLTAAQAARLFGLDARTCAAVLTTLTGRQVLRRTAGGAYRRGALARDVRNTLRGSRDASVLDRDGLDLEAPGRKSAVSRAAGRRRRVLRSSRRCVASAPPTT
jgi:hypothetical protein